MSAPSPSATSHPRRPRRHTRAAVALSILVHLATGWLLLRAPRTLSPTTAPLPVELEIITSEPAPTASESPAASNEAAPSTSQPTRPRPRSRPARSSPPTPSAPAPSEAPAPSAAPAPITLTPDVPLPRDEGTATLGMRFPPPRIPGTLLTPGYDTIDRLTREGTIAAPDAEAIARAGRPRGPTFSERLAARVRDDGARANVAEGKVHPAVYDLLRDARRDFQPTPEILADDPRTPNTVARTLRQWGRWLMETGHRELADQNRRLREHHAARRGKPPPDERDRTDEKVVAAATPIACLVCLVLRPPAAPEVVLGASSGNDALDRQAMSAVRRAADNRPLEADVRAQRSCYRFEATVFRVPPLPVLGCATDEKGGVQCMYPMKKLMKTTVTLQSVDYGG